MRTELFLIGLAVVTVLTGCAGSDPGFFRQHPADTPTRTTTETDIATDTVTVVRIPIDELATSGTTALHESRPCSSIPSPVVASAGFRAAPIADQPSGCVWLSRGNLALTVSSASPGMAEQVAAHERMATGTYDDRLAHLEWLRIKGHYAIEGIRAADATGTCTLILDISAPTVIHVKVHRMDPHTQQPVPTEPRKAREAFCPLTREAARSLLTHLTT